MDILLITTPVKPNGLGDFFRFATVRPGHSPLNLPEQEFLTLVRKYGMEVPNSSDRVLLQEWLVICQKGPDSLDSVHRRRMVNSPWTAVRHGR
jgi:hypothetical protein